MKKSYKTILLIIYLIIGYFCARHSLIWAKKMFPDQNHGAYCVFTALTWPISYPMNFMLYTEEHQIYNTVDKFLEDCFK